jgi:hypothetical protein
LHELHTTLKDANDKFAKREYQEGPLKEKFNSRLLARLKREIVELEESVLGTKIKCSIRPRISKPVGRKRFMNFNKVSRTYRRIMKC